MELILIRHALPVRREVADGAADPELSREGTHQARLLADYLGVEVLDALYTSPMRRAVQTAEPLAQVTGLSPVVVPGVAEWDQHSSEYIPVEELKATNDPRWQEMVKGGWTSEEIPQEFSRRVLESLEDIIARHRGHRVAVTCHGGVINEYLAHVLGLGSRQFFYPNYTSIHRVAASGTGHRSILSVNETPHLRGSGLPIGIFHS